MPMSDAVFVKSVHLKWLSGYVRFPVEAFSSVSVNLVMTILFVKASDLVAVER
jgi:hypothetical protein